MITFRLAEPDEIHALEALQLRASLMWDDDRPHLLAHPEAVEIPVQQVLDGHVRIVEHHGIPVGFSVVLPSGNHEAELDGLFVEPDHWRQGYGRVLIDDAAETARARGISTLNVIANPNALGFYQQLGFEHVGMAETMFRRAPRMRLLL